MTFKFFGTLLFKILSINNYLLGIIIKIKERNNELK